MNLLKKWLNAKLCVTHFTIMKSNLLSKGSTVRNISYKCNSKHLGKFNVYKFVNEANYSGITNYFIIHQSKLKGNNLIFFTNTQ